MFSSQSSLQAIKRYLDIQGMKKTEENQQCIRNFFQRNLFKE